MLYANQIVQYFTKSWPRILSAVASIMEAGDAHVLAAMDGRELGPTEKPPTPNPNNKEPTAFFFIIFGLVYEALSTSSEDLSGSSQRQSTVIPALRALKCLVRPEYSGKALLEPTIFDEFTSLSYRLTMTEPADVQVHLVEMLSAFAATQASPYVPPFLLVTCTCG
jgi:hypothetical protein